MSLGTHFAVLSVDLSSILSDIPHLAAKPVKFQFWSENLEKYQETGFRVRCRSEH